MKPIGKLETGSGHHGVAVPLPDGSALITAGTTDHRDTIRHVAADGSTLAETNDCPGVHGEAPGKNGRVAFGCENGPIVFDGSAFHKVPVEHAYQRSGNMAGGDAFAWVLADNKTDKDNKHEHPTSVALIDTQQATMRTVELGESYWFRSLGRTEDGQAIVLTTDGHLKVIDPQSATVVKDIPVIDSWTEKDEWQQPGPILKVRGTTAFVTDAEKKELAVVDLTSGEVAARHQLSVTPTEMAIVDGHGPAHSDADADAAHPHEHDHDHGHEH